MAVKSEVLLQLFNKSKLRNGTKTYLEQIKFFSLFIVKFKKLGFSAPLSALAYLYKFVVRANYKNMKRYY